MNESIKKVLATISSVTPLLLLFTAVLNIWLASRLAPLAQADAVQIEEIRAAEAQILDIKSQIGSHVTKDEFSQVVTRIDHISQRVDAIYNIVATK